VTHLLDVKSMFWLGLTLLVVTVCVWYWRSRTDEVCDGAKQIYRLNGSQIRNLPWHDLRLVLRECSQYLDAHDGIFRFDTPLGKVLSA